MEDVYPVFGIGNVPVKVASKVLGMKPDTIRNKMEDGTLDLGVIYKARKKRGKRSYRNTYISPKKLYDLTGYVWKGENENDTDTDGGCTRTSGRTQGAGYKPPENGATAQGNYGLSCTNRAE